MKIKLEGDASIGINTVLTVCKFCNNNDRVNSVIELNARENKIMFLCSQCKKMNEIKLGLAPHEMSQPLPKTHIGR